jgi:hypothetical protein
VSSSEIKKYINLLEGNIPNEDAILLAIAKKYLGIDTLDARNSDSLDFYDVAVWSIKDALKAAYEAGKVSK